MRVSAFTFMVLLGSAASWPAQAQGLRSIVQGFFLTPPEFAKPKDIVWPDQGWKPDAARWYHHADQGTRTFALPYEWMMALGRPRIGWKPFADQDYLDRFGFIRDDDPHGIGLPIGFAKGGVATLADGSRWNNPATGKAFSRVGLTCAACHTGRLEVGGTEIRIEGAPAMANLKLFQAKLAMALVLTRYYPFRFGGFAERVLGPGASPDAKAALEKQIDSAIAEFLATGAREAIVASGSVDEGFGRLDALNRIGNQVFSVDLDEPRNFASETAPVHFPRIWDSSWFTWVQYDGSIMQPMVRNAGEAMGVSAPVTFKQGADLFKSTMNVDALYGMEQMLAGTQPTAATGFTGLRAPRWDDPALAAVLPAIDKGLAAKGEALYTQNCQSCHEAPVTSPAFWASPKWVQIPPGSEHYLDVELVPLAHVGTDPGEARGLHDRTVVTPPWMGVTSTAFGTALGQAVQKVIERAYADHVPPLSADDRDRMNGGRPNRVDAPLVYKARPLDGVWATPPYLHNGSVPSLYELLSPVAERTKILYLGSRAFDPVNVGIDVESTRGASTLDTSTPGNSNAGHEFSDHPGPGVIGRLLSPDERRALVEYLKTI